MLLTIPLSLLSFGFGCVCMCLGGGGVLRMIDNSIRKLKDPFWQEILLIKYKSLVTQPL